MIESIDFKNFKPLRDAKLPLSQFTLIVGPNGSGKSTALTALMTLARPHELPHIHLRSVGTPEIPVTLEAKWREQWHAAPNDFTAAVQWTNTGCHGTQLRSDNPGRAGRPERPLKAFASARLFSLDASAIGSSVPLT